MERLINVLGGNGFVGSRYRELTENVVINANELKRIFPKKIINIGGNLSINNEISSNLKNFISKNI